MMTASQRAIEMYAEDAKRRQVEAGGDRKSEAARSLSVPSTLSDPTPTDTGTAAIEMYTEGAKRRQVEHPELCPPTQGSGIPEPPSCVGCRRQGAEAAFT